MRRISLADIFIFIFDIILYVFLNILYSYIHSKKSVPDEHGIKTFRPFKKIMTDGLARSLASFTFNSLLSITWFALIRFAMHVFTHSIGTIV